MSRRLHDFDELTRAPTLQFTHHTSKLNRRACVKLVRSFTVLQTRARDNELDLLS